MKVADKISEKEKIKLKHREEYYQRKLSQYKTWLSKADQLLEAAKLLKPKIEADIESARQKLFADDSSAVEDFPSGLLEVYFLLVGFAVENSLKAKWVKQNRRGKKKEIFVVAELPNELKTHNLLQLAKKVRLRLYDDESELLGRLSEYVEWASRYPVPTKAKYLKPRFISGSDLSKLNNLVSGLNQRLWRKVS